MKKTPPKVTTAATGGVPSATNQAGPPNRIHAKPRWAAFLADILLLGSNQPVGGGAGADVSG